MDFQIKQDNFDLVKSMNETALKQGLEMCAGTAENYAKKLCPVDTGRLRQSIGHSTGDREAVVGTNVEYAEFVELGTRYQHAQPYLKPALAELNDRAEMAPRSTYSSGLNVILRTI